MGAVMGVKDTYVVPYLSDELGASSQLISEFKLSKCGSKIDITLRFITNHVSCCTTVSL